MKNKNFFRSFFILIIFFLVGFFLINYSSQRDALQIPQNIKYVKIAGQNVNVDLALTEAEQTQGLSGRLGLDENQGMLFVFDQPGKYNFWMKDMNFPIDMIWLGADASVVYIKKNATPESYPQGFGPGTNDGDAKYVLEVVSGFSDKNNLKVGDRVEFMY